MKKISSGKVREIYDLEDGKMLIVTSDRISAFDMVLPSQIPQKGVILNKMSKFWFDFSKDLIANHCITINNAEMPEEFQTEQMQGRCMLVKKLTMLPVECIVRGYITGSGWESYKKTSSVCGIELPAGLEESQKLPRPIFTPTTKAKEGHDEHIDFIKTIDLLGQELANQVREVSIKLYNEAEAYARQKSIIIADTKFEFGLDEDGKLVLADELLTPDSSRFWPVSEYEVGQPQPSYDKQRVRDWLKYESGWDKKSEAPELPLEVIEDTVTSYKKAYEKLTGEKI